jgi:hypothetical protein
MKLQQQQECLQRMHITGYRENDRRIRIKYAYCWECFSNVWLEQGALLEKRFFTTTIVVVESQIVVVESH